ncbi:MAG: ComEC/Rec2 family competence protein [Flavobacteriaceae bacterium]
MKKLLEYLPLHFLLFLILGICVQFYTDLWSYGIEKMLLVLLLSIGLLFLFKKKIIFIFIVWGLFFCVGMFRVFMDDTRQRKSYFENVISQNNTSILRVKEVLKSNDYYAKYIVEVLQVNEEQTKGLVLLNIKKDSLLKQLRIDNKLLIQQEFTKLNSLLNPHQFDYRKYLAKQGVHRQVFLETNQFLMLESNSKSLMSFISSIRGKIQKSLQKHFSKDKYGVINALLLGQRQEVSKGLIDDYAKAGAIHILAVSGLHVGIILLILSFLLKPLELILYGKSMKLILIVLFLWFFALLAGMSASVVRAVTMFSAVALGRFLEKKNAIEYSLIFSMFILLLCKPMFLFDVGFQLSYVAVFGIVWVQPKLYSLWNSKNMITDKIWQLTSVSIAAQLGVLPLSLYYFHQFPSLFLVSNLIIIPFLGILLVGGIVIIILSISSLLPAFLADSYGATIRWLNHFVEFIANQESFLIKDISFSAGMLIASYLLIIFGVRFFIEKKAKRLLLFLSAVLVFQSILLYEKYETEQHDEFIIFHKSRNTLLGHREGPFLNVFNDLDALKVRKLQLLTDYKVGKRVELKFKKQLSNIFSHKNQQFLIVDSNGIYELDGLQKPIIILKQSPKINLRRLIMMLEPTLVIADGSNYKNFMLQWKQVCLEAKVPFWNTYEMGSFQW